VGRITQRLSNMKAMVPSILCGLRSASVAPLWLATSGPWSLMALCRLAPPGEKPPALAS
jgi:hypothetical protein